MGVKGCQPHMKLSYVYLSKQKCVKDTTQLLNTYCCDAFGSSTGILNTINHFKCKLSHLAWVSNLNCLWICDFLGISRTCSWSASDLVDMRICFIIIWEGIRKENFCVQKICCQFRHVESRVRVKDGYLKYS